MTITTEILVQNRETQYIHSAAERLGSVSMYFVANERTSAELRNEQALLDLQWEELSGRASE